MDRICLAQCERSCLRGFGRYRYRCRWRSIPRRLSLGNIPGIEGAVLLPGKNISANTCLYIDLFDSVIACTYQ